MFAGIWADDSEDEERGTSELNSKRKGGIKDYTAPVSFISGGVQQSGKKKEPEKEAAESDEDDEDKKAGLGSSKIQNSSDSEEEVRPSFKPQQTAGMRQHKGAMSGKGKRCSAL